MIRFILWLCALFVIFKLASWLYNGGLETIQKEGLKHVVMEVWEGESGADSTGVKDE